MHDQHDGIMKIFPHKNKSISSIDSLDSYPVEGTPNGRTGVMVDNAVGLVMDHPTPFPRSVGEFHIFPIERGHQGFKASDLLKLSPIEGTKPAAHGK